MEFVFKSSAPSHTHIRTTDNQGGGQSQWEKEGEEEVSGLVSGFRFLVSGFWLENVGPEVPDGQQAGGGGMGVTNDECRVTNGDEVGGRQGRMVFPGRRGVRGRMAFPGRHFVPIVGLKAQPPFFFAHLPHRLRQFRMPPYATASAWILRFRAFITLRIVSKPGLRSPERAL